MSSLKICSYNVNSIRARKELIFSWFDRRSQDLDVICFQETKVEDEKFPLTEFEELGYSCEIYGQKRYNGLAICSRLEQSNVRRGFDDSKWDTQKRILCSKIKGIKLINVYAPHGDLRGTEKNLYKLNWYKRFLHFLEDNYNSKDNLIVLGDFNVAFKDQDVYDPDLTKDLIGTMQEERDVFKSLLDWGLVDLFRFLYPNKKEFTWWDYIGGAIWKNAGMRIDYIFCTESLLKIIDNVEIDLWVRKRRKPTPSDHAPIVAELNL